MPRPLVLHVLALVVSALTLPVPVRAQNVTPSPESWPRVLTAGRFAGTGDFIRSAEPNRPFDVTLHGGVELLDLGTVHVPFDFAFDAAFDDRKYPQFVDYGFTFAPAVAVGAADLGLLVHHTSRHLHDMSGGSGVAWNTLGARAAGAAATGAWRLRGTVEASRYLRWSRGFVDYSWDVVGTGRASHDMSPRTAYYLNGMVRILRCDPEVAGRDWVVGARTEGGVNLGFGFGRTDFFVAWDRRIDPTPYSRSVVDFFVFGARFTAATGRDSRKRLRD